VDTLAETAILDYSVWLLPTKDSTLSFSVSVCSKQTEVCHLSLQQTNENHRFLLIPFL
jgi:hypothetical protein